MKVAAIVAVALLALAQVSFAQEAELEKLSQYIDSMKTQLLSSVNAQNLQGQLEPLAAQFQEQLKTLTANLEQQIKPLATNIQDQLRPVVTSFQEQLQAVIKSLGQTNSGK